ncbi:MAG: ATP-grasp domain-containing protein [Lachnospiraceae bacterium]|nr:ATP-grasp domain-containing protein [Lachnospiraceae bacterium]
MNAIILGGVVPHVELIEDLKKRGYHTILLDYLEHPPARPYADEFFQVSTLERDKVLKIAQDRKADLIITICVDHANVTMCYVAEKLGLPLPYSLDTAIKTTDKGLMKKSMMEGGIPTTPFCILSPGDPIPEDLSFPLVVKPVDNNGSKGVKRANDRDELARYVEAAFAFSRKGQVIVEGFSDGMEIQVDCFANHARSHVIMTRQKLEMPRREGIALQSVGSVIPAPLSSENIQEIGSIAERMVSVFGFEHTPFFFQAKMKDGQIRVLEVSPRIGGGLSYKMLKQQMEFDVVNTIIDSYFGNIDSIKIQPKDQCMLTNIVYASGAVFDHMEGIDRMIEEGVIESFDLMIEKGKLMGEDMDSRNRVGAYLIIGRSMDVIRKKAERAYENISVIDSEGKVMQRGDICYKGGC